jgi:hypothetical protein
MATWLILYALYFFILFLLLFCDPASYSGLVMYYLNMLSGMVCPAALAPSGNQLFSSSLCLILSLEQTRLKNLLLYLCLYPLVSIVHRPHVYCDTRFFGIDPRLITPPTIW